MYVWNCSYSLKQSSHISFSYLQCTRSFSLHRTTGYLVVVHHLWRRSIKFIERLNRNMNKNRSGWSMVMLILLNPSIGREGEGRIYEWCGHGYHKGHLSNQCVHNSDAHYSDIPLYTWCDDMIWCACSCEFVCKLKDATETSLWMF